MPSNVEKKPCPNCGKPCQITSETCIKCRLTGNAQKNWDQGKVGPKLKVEYCNLPPGPRPAECSGKFFRTSPTQDRCEACQNPDAEPKAVIDFGRWY